MLLQDETCLKELLVLLNQSMAVLDEDEEINQALNYALFLEHHEQQISATQKYTLSDILYGRYYWFTKFLVLYEKRYGKDAGMEQQQFQIMEAMDHAGCIDGFLLEQIEQDLNVSE